MVTPISPETVNRARILSRCHPERTVVQLLGISRSTLFLIKKRGWRPAASRKRPMPSDFKIQFHHATRDELARHYRASNTAISRWKREAGL